MTSADGGTGRLRRWGRRYRDWPLWAKIAAPGALVVVAALGAGKGAPQAGAPVTSPTTVSVAATVAVTALPSTSVIATIIAPSTTSVRTTIVPLTTLAAIPEIVAATEPVVVDVTEAPVPAPLETAPPPAPAPSTSVRPLAAIPAPATKATDPRFATCKEAKAAGYGPYVQGQDVEYDWYRDSNHNRIVCE